ncbi:LysR family transcriptional regulator [Actinoallomurus bryophytorum]|uniref:LysR family transcriptional regulator n=1 Tax=Actinoallomurus bryophytorum TaxID=1490222 RepID=UPI001C89C2A5|nr:LysR family transcriptional regulator [Actinoallomurus bryophytorum]
MELRQLRYFLTQAEELHFGQAAAHEHIVQSALSQQLQRLAAVCDPSGLVLQPQCRFRRSRRA